MLLQLAGGKGEETAFRISRLKRVDRRPGGPGRLEEGRCEESASGHAVAMTSSKNKTITIKGGIRLQAGRGGGRGGLCRDGNPCPPALLAVNILSRNPEAITLPDGETLPALLKALVHNGEVPTKGPSPLAASAPAC